LGKEYDPHSSDAISVVPAEFTMETFVRGGSLEAILDANARSIVACARERWRWVRRSRSSDSRLFAAAERLGRIFGENFEAIFGPDTCQNSGHRTGSADMGDVAHLMPLIDTSS
jgi:hypothetical protein